MFENMKNFLKKFGKKQDKIANNSKEAAKERLHLVLMQDRANVSADFLELMKQEIIEVIKKYIDVDEKEIDVRLTNKENADGTNGAPALYANIPILNIKNEARKVDIKEKTEDSDKESKEEKKEDANKDKAEKIEKSINKGNNKQQSQEQKQKIHLKEKNESTNNKEYHKKDENKKQIKEKTQQIKTENAKEKAKSKN